MALQSRLLRGDPKLEAAAISDPAHIVPGTRGEQVRKIQLALIQLERANIQPDGIYAPSTSAAVLLYKQRRNIVNRSYQTTADNIVGKMTIASLDEELLGAELKPISLIAVHPKPRIALSRPKFAVPVFGIVGSSQANIPGLRPVPVRPFQAPGSDQPQEEVIIARGGIGQIRVLGSTGGNLTRSQLMSFYGGADNLTQVASLRRAKQSNKDFEEIDVLNDDTIFTFDALNCGETFFQARVSPPQPPQKLSTILRLLSLVDQSVTLPLPPGDYSSEPGFKSGLLSKQGTPLNPLPGRKINIFGEGESSGFEDYSSNIDFCSHTFSNGNGPSGNLGHRPWTADPRKPPGIPPKSVDNICCRGSPIARITINEVLRIGASKCRVTYAEARGRVHSDRLRAGLTGAKVIEEGDWGSPLSGHAIIFELA
jgi:peptidoglycan hydrolase-like protein with peptidoglycan-binding domain